ncbi:MAG: SRPBCC domain-containing protein [Xanthobacteraceae bacterium]
MPYTFTLTTTIPASPEEIYRAWLDSLAHSEMTGGAANMSEQLGAEVSAWDGYISGRNLELVPGERIVQSWRTSEFADEHGDSVITILLEEADEGTLLTLEHSNVPDEQRSYEEAGWQENYFEPMVAYFTGRKRETAATSPAKAAPKTAPKTAPKRATKTARNAKRSTGAKSKRAAPRAKAAPSKRKGKGRGKTRRAAAAAPTRKRVKPAKRKSGRGKRR